MKLRSVLACGVLALALVGCGEDDEDAPDAAPSSPVATSSSPSDEPSPTFDPTKETAKEFIRRWIRTSNEMQETGDTSAYREFTAMCMPCEKVADRIDRTYRNGGHFKTAGEEVVSVRYEGGDQWRVAMKAGKTTFVEEAGAEPQTYNGGEYAYVVLMERRQGAWSLISYQVAPT